MAIKIQLLSYLYVGMMALFTAIDAGYYRYFWLKKARKKTARYLGKILERVSLTVAQVLLVWCQITACIDALWHLGIRSLALPLSIAIVAVIPLILLVTVVALINRIVLTGLLKFDVPLKIYPIVYASRLFPLDMLQYQYHVVVLGFSTRSGNLKMLRDLLVFRTGQNLAKAVHKKVLSELTENDRNRIVDALARTFRMW